ncbi:MAG: cupin domain-containing protein, partial [Candidatus Eisenbacteria bacterium]|nr:cupin domain-containing protein [Candidatus Eisenbacteria bacterium]
MHTTKLAAVVLPCENLDETLDFFLNELMFRIDVIYPADSPSVAEISGHGLHLRLERGAKSDPGTLRLSPKASLAVAAGVEEIVAPNGTRIQFFNAYPPAHTPSSKATFVHTKADNPAVWNVGRAGMRYRDLIPGRQDGRIIASHIQIPYGGPVPDYVHYHHVTFQMIYCYKGWVKLVYEDQGEPFVLHEGDCVLQPPEIRHRVLENSPGLEVIEVGCPAEHATCADHNLTLPTGTVQEDRRFQGQTFVRHVAAEANWLPWKSEGYEVRDTGIQKATEGVATALVVRGRKGMTASLTNHEAELAFYFVLQGEAE